MNNKFLKHFLTLFGFLVSIGFVWFIIKKYDIKTTWGIVKSVPLYIIFLMVLIYFSAFYFRTLRWKLMLLKFPGLTFNLLFKSIILGFSGNNIIPARGGELLRMEFFSRNTKINRTTSLSSIVLEKIIDALILLALLVFTSLFITKNNSFLTHTIQITSLIFFPVILFIIVCKIKGELILKWLETKKGKSINLISKQFQNIFDALSFLNLDFNTFKIILLSFIIWLLEGLVFVLGIKAIGIDDESIFIIGMIALCIVNFGILIPSSPGYIGIFQAAFVIALASFKIPATKSLATAIIVHSCQFFPTTIFGLIIMAYEYFSIQKKKSL
jgi:glycosyltransferase 2 family protein